MGYTTLKQAANTVVECWERGDLAGAVNVLEHETDKEIYAITTKPFKRGDKIRSVFPTEEAEKSKRHSSLADAVDYMVNECGVTEEIIILAR